MALSTFKELKDNIASTVRDTQIDDLIGTFINLTGLEIHNGGPDGQPWTWTRRKQTFTTTSSQEDYNLDSEVDRIAFLRQTTTPQKLIYLPDHIFYRVVPNPEDLATGIPQWYRLWAETGFSTNLSSADTVYISSSSSSDGSSFTVRIVGRNSSGEIVAETLTLNGTTSVTSDTTWASGGLMRISKSGETTGTITCYDTTNGSTLAELEPDNLAPRYKRISLYPIPNDSYTIYYEYHERYRYLQHDTDVSQMDVKWNWVLREGALAKTWEYKQNHDLSVQHQAIFDRGLKTMQAQDDLNIDYIPVIQPRDIGVRSVVKRRADSVNNNFPSYSVGY